MRFFESADLVSVLMAKVPLGIAIVTQEGQYLFTNEMYRKILKVSESQLSTLSVSQCLGIKIKLHPPPSPVESQRIRIFSLNGQSQDLDLRQAPFESHTQQILILHTLQDVSESLRLQRMKDTSEKILFHDLRSPVSGVMSLAQLIQMERDASPEILPVVKEIYRRGEKMIVLLENLLDFSKMEEGRLKIYREPLPMKNILLGIHKSLSPEFKRKKVHLDFFLNQKALNQAEAEVFWSKESLIKGLLENTLTSTLNFAPPHTEVKAEFSLNSEEFLICVDAVPQTKASDPHLFDQIPAPDGQFIPVHYSTRLFLKALGGHLDTDFSGPKPRWFIRLPQIPGDSFYR